MNRKTLFYLLVVPVVTIVFSSIFLFNLDPLLSSKDNITSRVLDSYSPQRDFGAIIRSKKHVRTKNNNNNNRVRVYMKESINTFSNNLYNEVTQEKKSQQQVGNNVLISGFSVYMALLMTCNGASGTTLNEMMNTLQVGKKSTSVANKEVKDILNQLKNKSNSRLLGIANALFVDNSLEVKPEFLALTKDTFSSDLTLLNFQNSAEPSRQHINAWVAQQTKQMIQNLLPKDSITFQTRMVLVNAIYFKARWKTEFDAKLTRAAPFYTAALPDSSPKQVDMMHLFGQRFALGQNSVARWIHLPYVGDEFAMVIILPAKKFALAEVSKKWLAGQIPIHQVVEKKVDTLAVPKFKFTHEVQMKDLLQRMGIQTAFSDAGADFSHMTKNKDIFIHQVYHKAFIQVDEEGTKAAAATAVVMNKRSMVRVEKTEFIVDEPFLFSIIHIPTNITLFQGHVLNPLASN